MDETRQSDAGRNGLGTLRINEVFYSIQGESTRAGMPCVFVRLAGCHLRCAYCDTEYAFKEGSTRTIESLVKEVCRHPTNLVQVTGGEPLLQARAFDLMRTLCDKEKTVLVETSGACNIDGAGADDARVVRIVDVKTPGSGEHQRMDWENIERLRKSDEIKFVICDRTDYDYAVRVTREYGLFDRVAAVLLSPVFEQPKGLEILGKKGINLRNMAEWILKDGQPFVLQPQLHKFIWDPQTRGV